MDNNAVFREIIKINNQWNSIQKEDVSNIKLFCWKGRKDELEFVDAFIKYRISGEGDFKDMFLLFVNPFEDKLSYGHDMLTDLQHVLHSWHNGLSGDQQSQKRKWNLKETEVLKNDVSDASFFVNNVNTLHEYYGLTSKEKLFIVLSPSNISDVFNMNLWLSNLLKSNVHPLVKFVIYDNKEHPLFKKVTESHNSRVIIPEIDVMDVIMSAHNETSDSKDPATIFQKKLLEASKLLGDKDKEGALKKTLECVSIAKSHKLSDLLVTVYMFRANVFMIYKDKRDALKAASYAVENSENNQRLKLQALFFKGGLLLRYSKRDEAYSVYKECVPLADAISDDFLKIESRRLYGFFAEKQGHTDIAWNAYLEALVIAKKMDKQHVKNSTLGLLGKSMLYLSYSYDYAYDKLYAEIEDLLGKDWLKKQDSIKKAKEDTVLSSIN